MNLFQKSAKLFFILIFLNSTKIFAQISFFEHNISNSYSQAVAVHANDINNDGFIDIVSGSYANKIGWWQNDGNQNFTEHTISTEVNGVRSVYSDDLNGDGKIDILGAIWQDHDVIWWENNGDGNFTEHVVDSNFLGAHTVETSDVNGDGFMDILCSGFDLGNQSEIAWWENDGNENFTKHLISSHFKRSPFIHGSDIDQDGDIDILACGETNGEILWWENDGNQVFTEHIVDGNFAAAHTVFARDLDLDGDLDILGAACMSSLFTWWENDGDQNFTEHPIDQFNCALWIDAVDLDKDGDNDLIGTGTNGAFWWENDGSQNFVRYELPGIFSSGYCLISTDLDQDEDYDLIGAGRNCSRITWWENDLFIYNFKGSLRHGHAPLTVQFSDLSNSIEPLFSWEWDFENDGIVDSHEQNPEWTFDEPGKYSVYLKVSGESVSEEIVIEDYVSVFDGESALLFENNQSYVACPAIPALNIQEKITIETKINPSGWGAVPTIGFGRIVDKSKFALYLIESSPAFNDHSLAFQIFHTDGSSSITTSSENSITLDTWQHVAVTYDGSSSLIKMYINGIEQTYSQTRTPSGFIKDNSNDNLVIGNSANKSFSFAGIIDEVRIWNNVRTRSQIQENINSYLNDDELDLVGYWKMNEGNGDTITDNSNNNNSGIITKTGWVQGAPLNLPTSVKKKTNQVKLLDNYFLYQNYPNPFNPETIINYELPFQSHISLKIFDINGRLVRTLVENEKEAGFYTIVWDGKNSLSKNVSTGLYYLQMNTKLFTKTNKMMLIR